MRWEETHEDWICKRLTQEESTHLLGITERTFRHYVDRYEEARLEGLLDKRLIQVSHRKGPVNEVLRMEALNRERYDGRTVKHFHKRYQEEHQGTRSIYLVQEYAPGSRVC